MLELRGLDKSFPGVHALSDVSLRFAAGEIHGLVGENGAGKSTLMRLVTGLLEPDRGEVWFAGRRVRFRNARESMAAGIQLVQQEIQVIPESTVAENLMLDKLVTRGWGVLDWPAIHAQARKHLEVVGLPVPPETIAKTLSAAQKRLLQIAKALAARTRLLLLDEPTSCLGPHETAGLHALLRELKSQGIALIYVTHKLEEVFALCDRVSVLRDGHHVGTHPVAGLDHDRLVRLMVGREVRDDRVGLRPVSGAPEMLRVEGLTRRGRAHDISFTLRAGEILGCYGLVGSGRTETARLLIGDDRADAGRVWVRGKPVALRSVTENVRRWRLGYVSEDRKEEGLLLDFSVLANLTLTVWERLVNRWTRRIDPARERALGRHWADRLSIQCGSLENPVRNLSGGNQQKICLAKWLAADCEILIIDEPTVGVDLGAKEQIHQVIRDLAAREGKAVLLISSDMPEMIRLAHRILVFRDRRIVGEVAGEGTSCRSAGEISEAIGHFLN